MWDENNHCKPALNVSRIGDSWILRNICSSSRSRSFPRCHIILYSSTFGQESIYRSTSISLVCTCVCTCVHVRISFDREVLELASESFCTHLYFACWTRLPIKSIKWSQFLINLLFHRSSSSSFSSFLKANFIALKKNIASKLERQFN